MSERVLVITTSYPTHPGDAAGHFVHTEAHALARSNQVTVIAPGRHAESLGNPHVIWIADAGLFGFPGALAKLRAQPWRLWGAFGFARRAQRQIRELPRFDRVIAHWIVPSAWPIAHSTSRFMQAHIEVVAHGSDVRLLLRFPRAVRERLLGELLDQGATFRFVSEELLELLAREAPRELRERAHVLPSAIETNGTPERSAARRQLGIRDSERLVVIVGRLLSSKRVDVALCAAMLVSARVVVIGDGPQRAALERRFPAAEFIGQRSRSESLCWISAADALLSASRCEGAPTVVREARALGTPVAAVRAGDLALWAARDPELLVIR